MSATRHAGPNFSLQRFTASPLAFSGRALVVGRGRAGSLGAGPGLPCGRGEAQSGPRLKVLGSDWLAGANHGSLATFCRRIARRSDHDRRRPGRFGSASRVRHRARRRGRQPPACPDRDRRGDYFIEDLHSRNGTFVNGRLIEGRQLLQNGDRLKICDLSFTFYRQLAQRRPDPAAR